MSLTAAAARIVSAGSGASIYLQSGANESLALHDVAGALLGDAVRPLLFSALAPGLNAFDYAAAAGDGALLETVLLPSALRAAFKAGRIGLWTTSYFGAALRIVRAPAFDVAIVQGAPPENGRAGLGLCADYAPLIWDRARLKILLLNSALPSPRGAATIDAAAADFVIGLDGAIPVLAPQGENAVAAAIAAHVASLVRDGAVLQIGIGRIPNLILHALQDRRGLVFHSGAIGDGFIDLANAGALAPGRAHRIGSVLGSAALHRFVAEEDMISLVDTSITHAPSAFPALTNFTAINSALEVDLFGQINLEWRRGEMHGGVGGAPDFARGAKLAPDGRSIVALPSLQKPGGPSRIVARLDTPSVSMSAIDADTIVTEHGVAEIAALALDARAEALIAIASPEHRAALAEAWRTLRSGF
jgi:acyl-CoA hydrolase